MNLGRASAERLKMEGYCRSWFFHDLKNPSPGILDQGYLVVTDFAEPKDSKKTTVPDRQGNFHSQEYMIEEADDGDGECYDGDGENAFQYH